MRIVRYSHDTMKKSRLDTALNDRIVYAALVMDPNHLRTQTQVAREFGMPKSTVNGCVNRLLSRKFIVRINGMVTDIFYRKGKNAPLIESYISADLENKRKGYDQVDKVPDVSRFALRVHLNGGWMSVPDEKEGSFSIERNCGMMTEIFSSNPSHPTGCEMFKGAIDINGETFKLQYLRSVRKSTKTMKIAPPERLQTAEQVCRDSDEGKDPFYPAAASVLAVLEKRAGWSFARNKIGNYAVTNRCRVEYGFDRDVSDSLIEILGSDYGVPGRTHLWNDASDGALGEKGEFETDDVSFIEALNGIPETANDLRRMKGDYLSFKKETRERLNVLEGKK